YGLGQDWSRLCEVCGRPCDCGFHTANLCRAWQDARAVLSASVGLLLLDVGFEFGELILPFAHVFRPEPAVKSRPVGHGQLCERPVAVDQSFPDMRTGPLARYVFRRSAVVLQWVPILEDPIEMYEPGHCVSLRSGGYCWLRIRTAPFVSGPATMAGPFFH